MKKLISFIGVVALILLVVSTAGAVNGEIFFRTTTGENYYWWQTKPEVEAIGNAVIVTFSAPISSFKGRWPSPEAFRALDNNGGKYTVQSVVPLSNSAMQLHVVPAIPGNVEVTIQYSQRFDNDILRINDTKGSIIKAGTNSVLPCTTMTVRATSNDLKITDDTMQYFIVDRAVSYDLTAKGGTEPYTWNVMSGSMPPLVVLSADGHVYGVPTTLGTYTPTIEVQDTAGKVARKMFTFTVTEDAVLMILTESLSNAGIGSFYSETLRGYGGIKPYSWSAEGLPDWLSLDKESGILSGTPSYPGSHEFTVKLTDSSENVVSRLFRLTVNEHDGLLIETRILDAAPYNKDYSCQLEASGGTPPYIFTVRSGYQLPHGLSLSSAGLLSGKPSRRYSYDFVLDVMDSRNLKGSAVYTMVIVDDSVLKPSGSDFKAKMDKNKKIVKISFYLPKGYNDTEVLSVEALSSPAGLVSSSSSALTRENNGAWKTDLFLHISEYEMKAEELSWDEVIDNLYFDGLIVKFQNCSGEIMEFEKSLAVKDLQGKDDGGGCNVGKGLWMFLGVALLLKQGLVKASHRF